MADDEDRRMFGYTNDPVWIERARAWRDAAVADGWSIEPTYPNNEGADRACRLKREGFVAQIITRETTKPEAKYRYEASVSVWAPDDMTIVPPDVYDWAEVRGAATACNQCGKGNLAPEDMHRYGFAGRCCTDCLPAMRAKHERPGWTL